MIPRRQPASSVGARAVVWGAGVLALLAPSAPARAVINGIPAGTCQFPTTVALDDGTYPCTGFLVHPEVVMYAAHCHDGYKEVWFGEDGKSPARRVPTKFCKTHPDRPAGETRAGISDWAFCVLAEPVTDLPPTPVLMGCELDELVAGREVFVAGYGKNKTELPLTRKKHWASTKIAEVPTDGETIWVGLDKSDGATTCSGDSGGPAYIQLADGTWHVFGIVSGKGCDGPALFMRIDRQIAWFEKESGFDLTPCHDVDGSWNPNPDCGGFPTDLKAGAGAAGGWEAFCAGRTIAGMSATCGAPYGGADGGGGAAGDGGAGSGGAGGTGGGGAGGGGAADAADGGGSGGGGSDGGVQDAGAGGDDDEGCGCRTAGRSTGAGWIGVVVGIGLSARRRRSSRVLAV